MKNNMTKLVFIPDRSGSVSEAVCQLRRRAPLARNWSRKIEEDYNSRK